MITELEAWGIFLSPLIASPIALVAGRKSRNAAGIIASASIGLSLVLAFLLYLNISSSTSVESQYNWFYDINYGIFVDHLAIVMLLMVALVSLMIHLFALYYMGGDPNRHAYFAETALFTSGMLGLVEASNLLECFMCWELVGLCAYLLIGFWFFKANAASAAKNAFIVTRVGDLLFLIGLAVLYSSMSSVSSDPLSISFIVNNASRLPSLIGQYNLTLVSLLFLGGAIGKSSQFPLHVWIPDAMEGPTTVSALIHAATMVTAGIYLVARVYPLFYEAYPVSLYIVLFIGSFTALFAGTIGIVVNDIKRILAYSTISQLGYMLAALGLGSMFGPDVIAYSMYHLVVHAFFKALLFMSAGAILLALMDLRDVRQMGGLWKRMPYTVSLLFIGSITLAAVPFTSAYFSKDTIIGLSYTMYQSSGTLAMALPWLFLQFGALATVLYTFRMFFMVALGKPRSHLASEAKDPKKIVLIPLAILAVLSLGYGVFQGSFYGYVSPGASVPAIPAFTEMLSIAFLLIGLAVTYFLYAGDRFTRIHPEKIPGYRLLANKYYLDRLFTNAIAQGTILPLSSSFAGAESRYNGAVERFGGSFLRIGNALRKLQSGVVENYFLLIIIAAAAVFIVLELAGGL